MAWPTAQLTERPRQSAWALARTQHGVVSRDQLFALGLTKRGIEHRTARGRLHIVARGIYAVGRPELSEKGKWMAAILVCGGPGVAALSHSSAAAFFGIGVEWARGIEVSRLSSDPIRTAGIKVHRRPSLDLRRLVIRDGIPVTSPVQTLIDLATRHHQRVMERMINEADGLKVVRTDELRRALDEHNGERGVARLRRILDRRTFRYTRSELERAFLPLAEAAGLPSPRTSVYVDGHEVDFHFPTLNLVVETDSLTYHRTPAQQSNDRRRDHDHFTAQVRQLRFTHAQIKFDSDHVVRVLRSAAIIPS